MVIGLTGRAGAGKDTAFRMLVREASAERFVRKAFADLLKESAMLALGLDPEDAEAFKERGRITVRYGEDVARELTGREFFQRYGLEAHREVFGADFWTKRVLNPEVLDPKAVTVVTDVRMDDEAEQIRELGGEIWRIERSGPGIDEADHGTEQGVSDDLVTRRIYNTGSPEDLGEMMAEAFGAAKCLL